jgi:hypothetical protein
MIDVLDALRQNAALDQLVMTGNFDLRFPSRYEPRYYFHTMDFSDNYLMDFPAWMIDPEGLTYLDISDNEINVPDFLYQSKKCQIDTLVTDIHEADDTLLVRNIFPKTVCSFVYDTSFADVSCSYHNGSVADINKLRASDFSVSYQSVLPPVAEQKVPFLEFSLAAQGDQVVRTAEGTRISIPAGSLVDDKGNTVTGDYQVYYREFNDLASLFYSGIPMTYDSGGQRNAFETAGMFEIYAMQDSAYLQLKPGASIDIQLPTVSRKEGFNLYRYNDSTANWELTEGDADQITVSTKPRIYSRAYQFLYLLDTYPFDTCTFESRFESPQYARTRKLTGYFWGVKKDLHPFFKVRKVRSGYKDRELVLFRFPYIYSKKQRKHVISTGSYRELSLYCNYTWEYHGTLNRQQFVKTYCRSNRWTDARLEYNDASDQFTMTLKSPQGTVELTGAPRIPNIKDEEKMSKAYEKLDTRYTKSLTRSQIAFDRTIDRRKARDLRKDWRFIRNIMSSEEREMPENEWIAYAQRTLDNQTRIDSQFTFTARDVTRALSINGFGIWNCDRIITYPNSINVLAELRDQENNYVKPERAWLVNKSAAGVIPMDIKGGKVLYQNVPNAMFSMCFVDPGGNLYVSHYNVVADHETVRSSKVLRCSLLENTDNESLHSAMGF